MKKLLSRKTILLSLIAVFLVIYILQLSLTGKNKVTVLKINTPLDSIKITDMNGSSPDTIELTRNGEKWFIGDYEADKLMSSKLNETLSSMKVLGTASTSTSDYERYGLNEEAVIKVEASANGKTLRRLTIGKDNSNSTQSYVLIDGASSVSVISAPLHSTFTVDEDKLRSKNVYTLESSEITRISLSNSKGKTILAKTTSKPEAGTDETSTLPEVIWTLENTSGPAPELDQSTVVFYASSISTLDVSSWFADDAQAPAKEPDITAEITCGEKTVTVSLYAPDEESKDPVATCSESPYVFTVSQYQYDKFEKSLTDFLKSSDE